MGNGGSYPRTAKVEFLSDGRIVRLLEDFVYIDPKSARWKSPKGALADGASIPRPLWPLIGGPFEGKYRDASIIHDFYCSKRNRPWKQVHRMFFDAMITSGVRRKKALLMYGGVYLGGPKWSQMDVENANLPLQDDWALLQYNSNRFVRVTSWVRSGGAGGADGGGGRRASMLRNAGRPKPVPYRYVMKDEDVKRLESAVNRKGSDLKSVEKEIDQMLVGRKKTRSKSFSSSNHSKSRSSSKNKSSAQVKRKSAPRSAAQ